MTARSHQLKCHPALFADVEAGIKNFEVRNDDRGYRVGDVLILVEWPQPGIEAWYFESSSYRLPQVRE